MHDAYNILREPTVMETIDGILNNLDALKVFQNDLETFFTEIDTLRKIPRFEMVENAIEVIKVFRNSTSKKASLSTVTTQLPKIQKKLSEFSSFIKNSKNSAQIEVNSLSEFKDIGRNSQVIGTATRGILNMQKLMNATIDFQAFEDMKYLTKKEILELEKKMSSQDVRNLKSLAGIGGELRTVVNEVINFKNLLPAFSANLLDYGGVFIQATKIKGIAIDCPAFIASLEKLKNILASWFFSKLSIDQLDKIMISLEFHLDFSKFSKALNGSAESLQALEMHFAKYKDTLKKAKNGTASSFSQPQSGAGFMEK